MKVLVTGGAGFIGSHTVDLLLRRGYEVRILDALLPPVHLPGVVPPHVPADAEFIQGDVRDRDALDRALRGVDYVFHLAAYQDYLTDFSTFFHTNSVGTALLFELIINQRYPVQKVVVASSQAVYGEGRHHCPEHGVQYPDARPIERLRKRLWEVPCPACGAPMVSVPTDESVVRPHNQYATSKYTQEMIALSLGRRYQIPTVALRYSITQGPRQSFRNAYSGILRIFTLSLLHGLAPLAYEDGQQRRDYVYVGDVARANLLVLEDPRADYQVFNVGGGAATTVVEYARIIADVVGRPIEPLIPGEFRVGDTRHIVSDIGRLRSLGWEPTKSPREIAETYVAWASAQPDVENYAQRALEVMRSTQVIQQAATLPA